MQVIVSAANMWVTVFIVIMQMGVSVTIMQVVFSAVHYAHDFQVTISYSVLKLTASLQKIDQKTFKSVISGLHFTTFVNILLKIRYFEGRNDIQIGYKSCSVLLFSQKTYGRYGHLGFLEMEGNLRKRGGGGYDSPYEL